MASFKVAGIGQSKKYSDVESYNDTIRYISNPDKAAYTGCFGVSSMENAATEMVEVAEHFHKNSGKRVRHSILSFSKDEHVTPEMANDIAQEIVQHYAPEYQIGYAVHNNTDETHIHMVMNMVSYVDGHRYAGKKKDFYEFLDVMRDATNLPVMYVK